MQSQDWSNGLQDGQSADTYQLAYPMDNSAPSYTLELDPQQRTPLSPSQPSLGELNTSPYPIHDDGNNIPASPVMSSSPLPSTFYDGYSNYHFSSHPSASSSNDMPTRHHSIQSITSERMPPRPREFASPFVSINHCVTTPELQLPVPPVPPQIPPRITLPLPEMPLSPRTLAIPHMRHDRPLSVHEAPGHDLSQFATPMGHSLSTPSLPSAGSHNDSSGGSGYMPSPTPSPQPSHPSSLTPRPSMRRNNVPGSSGSNGPSTPTSLRPKHYIGIGIDFGTTYSGVSWVYSGNPDNIHDVQQYPSAADNHKCRDEAQVPTLLDIKTGHWGFLIDGDDDPIRWFKLLLLNDADMRCEIHTSAYLQATRGKTKQLGSDGPVQLVAKFLEQLWRVALREIALVLTKNELDSLPLKVALTVPAIWPGYAKEAMKRAVRVAGILDMRAAGDTELVLVQEPEAAALATLTERRAYPDVVEGETFMVVDCGGGTIDVISYKVLSVDPFRVCEVVPGDGKLCGAYLIDDKFASHLKQHSGFHFDQCARDAWRQFVYAEWEQGLKRCFTYGPEQAPAVHLTPPVQAMRTLRRVTTRWGASKLVLRRDTVDGFFDETYQGILALVQAQYGAILRAEHGRDPKTIMLVGGLGSSRYLATRLKHAYPNIVQPRHAWSAVARGAVIALLDGARAPQPDASTGTPHPYSALPEVASRIARLSYGVNTGVAVSEAEPPADRARDTFIRGLHRDAAPRIWRMKWFVAKGETLDNRDPVSHTFYDYVNSCAATSTTFLIYVSAADTPPVRLDASCSLLCTLSCAYDTPFASLPVVDARTSLRKVDNMQLTMRFGGEPEWQLQVGQRAVKEKVNVDYEMR